MDILDIIQRKATHINTLDELKERLASGKQLRVKYGIDPSNPNIHLGHTVPLRLLKQFQDAGHKAIIILGDYTASLGDPTGRDHLREGVNISTARSNSVKYIAQLRRLINTDIGKCEMHYNSGWLEHYKTSDWLERMRHWTIQQIIDRDDFKNRMAAGDGVHLSELMYTLFQGEDSVRVRADIELGGNEQLFTLMVGREMQKQAGQTPQICITLPILRGIDGKKRMGKSLGNFIGINEEPFEMFSKIMSIPDDLMPEWTNLLTDLPKTSDNPMADKMMLAKDIVGWLHTDPSLGSLAPGSGAEIAIKAHEKWRKQFSMKEQPEDIRTVAVNGSTHQLASSLFNLVYMLGLTPSKNMAKRLIEQGAVQVNGKKIVDPLTSVELSGNPVIKCGRKFAKVEYHDDRKTS
jgi:tyrosyl-tRNA synthetase